MLGAWRTSDPCLSVEKRMGITMSDAGVSITVTSFTNFGCFSKLSKYFKKNSIYCS